MSQIPLYFLLSLPLIGAYAMLAIGIVVVFRASKVLNLANGAMAMLPAYVSFAVTERGLPMIVAVPFGVASGAVLGMLVERLFVRPLAKQGPTAQTVGTIAVFGVMVAAVAQIFGSSSRVAPQIFPDGGITLSTTLLRWSQLGLFAIALVTAAGFFALFAFTRVGLWMRGAAENATAAGLMGVDPDRMARLAWSLGGGLAGLAGILLAGATNLNPFTLSLQMLPAFVAALIGGLGSLPGALIGSFIVGTAQGMVPAFALIPGLESLASQVGIPQLVLAILAFTVMFFRGQRFSTAEGQSGIAAAVEAGPSHSAFDPRLTVPRAGGRRVLRFAVLAVLVAWPFFELPGFLPIDRFSLLGDGILASQYFLVAASLVMLTGWVGQISLAQASFVGVSAFGSALLFEKFGVAFPWSLPIAIALASGVAAFVGVISLRVRGLYLAVTTLIFAWMADEYLFVVPWFAGRGGTAEVDPVTVGRPGAIPSFDLTDRRTFYFIALAVAAAVLFGLMNLRDSKTGRAFFALRGSEAAAASLGIDVTRHKLLAFAIAGGIAGLAGNLIINHQVTVTPAQFSLQGSLLFVAVAVVGGLHSLGGAIAASILFASLNEIFFRVPSLGSYLQLVSALLLAIVLLVYPGGLAAIPGSARRLRHRVARAVREARQRSRAKARDREVGDEVADEKTEEAVVIETDGEPLDESDLDGEEAGPSRAFPLRGVFTLLARLAGSRRAVGAEVGAEEMSGSNGRKVTALVVTDLTPFEPPGGAVRQGNGSRIDEQRDDDGAEGVADVGLDEFGGDQWVDKLAAVGPVIEAEGVTVRFGGLTAVDDASLRVEAGQIVGLIGPNGAGKTTLFNAISGLNSPTAGRIRLFGEDVTSLPVHERAARGLGRTFQVIQLFPELTVFENLLVATHQHNPTGPLGHAFVTTRAVRSELLAEETCRRVVRFLGLGAIADRRVAGLSFGTLRLVELARALVTGAPALMLDEPASGLDNAETDRFTDALRFVRDRLGVTILLIEHDIRMVASVTDHVYVLNRGIMLTNGAPADIQRDPEVMSAYLGTPEGGDEPKPERGGRGRQRVPEGAT